MLRSLDERAGEKRAADDDERKQCSGERRGQASPLDVGEESLVGRDGVDVDEW